MLEMRHHGRGRPTGSERAQAVKPRSGALAASASRRRRGMEPARNFRIYVTGPRMQDAMEAEQDFETWLSMWTKERIVPTHGFLEGADLHYMTKRRAAELIQLARDKGFDDKLAEVVKPYHSVLKYVTHLMWEADFNSFRSRYSSESGDT
jgi:hypothetical protein